MVESVLSSLDKSILAVADFHHRVAPVGGAEE
jgi:hypothetical protein